MKNINEITINSLEKEINILKEQRKMLFNYIEKIGHSDKFLNYVEKIEDRNSVAVQMAKYDTKKTLVKK